MRPKADLVIFNASQLLTLRGASENPVRHPSLGSLGIVEKGFVASAKGRIISTGKSSEIHSEVDTSDAIVVDARGKVVMPGFVDSHTHSAFAGSREAELDMKLQGMSYMDILKRGGGILSTVKETRSSTRDSIVSQTKSRVSSMLKHGTTTIEIKSGYGLDLETELKILDAIKALQKGFPGELIPTYLGAHALPPEFDDSAEYANFIVETVLEKAAISNLAEFCDIFCEQGVFDIGESRLILEKARKLGMRPKIHADEFSRIGATRLAVELGAISADHMLNSSEEDIHLISKSRTIATLLPSTPFCSLVDKYAPARKFLDAGCAVALATDLSPNAWCESMQLVVQLAVLKMRMRVHEAIIASTINGAHAVQRGGETGSLEVGKRMDALILDVPNFQFLAYKIGVNLIGSVIVRGKVIVPDAHLAA